jgi:microsomal dipeptidase-like Zn-dependent dipeptidase
MIKKMKITGFLFLIMAVFFACSQEQPQKEAQEPFESIHERAITLDTHVDIGRNYATEELDPGINNPRLKCDLTKMENGGMDGVFLAVYVGQGKLDAEGYKSAYDTAMTKFNAIHRLTEEMYPERCELATSPDDTERIVKTGKRAIMIGIENGYPVGEDLSLVKEYYDLGARYITLCHGGHNQICDSSSPDEPLHNGISDFGKKVVAEMNRLGIICDVSHISEKSFWDLIEISKAPIIASHSGCSEINQHSRNLTDEQLKALAKNGGAIQIIPLSSFLKAETPEHREAMNKLREEVGLPSRREIWRMSQEEREALQPKFEEFNKLRVEVEKKYPPTDLQDFVDHIDHAVKIAGIDHVGIGTDFDGGGGIPGFNNHAEAGNVTEELVRRGYSDEEIMKIWGGNLLRVWREVEKTASE